MFPQENRLRELRKLGGIFRFKPDFEGVSHREEWQNGLTGYREIAVPASWNEQYEDLMDFFGDGWYETDLFVPLSWDQKAIWLQFGSVCTNCIVYIDGNQVGEHRGGSLPFEFLINEYVKAGNSHRLTILADGHLDPWGLPPAQLEEGEARVGFFNSNPGVTYDFFPYMGIHRDIYLYCTNEKRIESVRIDCELAHLPESDVVIHSRIGLSAASDGELSLEILNQGMTVAG